MLRGEVVEHHNEAIEGLVIWQRLHFPTPIAANRGVAVAKSNPRAKGHDGSTENRESNRRRDYRDLIAVLISGRSVCSDSAEHPQASLGRTPKQPSDYPASVWAFSVGTWQVVKMRRSIGPVRS